MIVKTEGHTLLLDLHRISLRFESGIHSKEMGYSLILKMPTIYENSENIAIVYWILDSNDLLIINNI
jgi:hypothetical protein